jgi:hypothetical protein
MLHALSTSAYGFARARCDACGHDFLERIQTSITSIGKRSRFVFSISTHQLQNKKVYTNAMTTEANATQANFLTWFRLLHNKVAKD